MANVRKRAPPNSLLRPLPTATAPAIAFVPPEAPIQPPPKSRRRSDSASHMQHQLTTQSWIDAAAPTDALLDDSMQTAQSSKFRSVIIDPHEAYDEHAPIPHDSFIEQEPERAADGALTTWPWLQQHSGQIWSTPSTRAPCPLDRMIHLGLDNASADGQRGRKHSGVRAWFAFVEAQHLSPHRPLDPISPLMAKLDEEWGYSAAPPAGPLPAAADEPEGTAPPQGAAPPQGRRALLRARP